jgi:hypothetical protein
VLAHGAWLPFADPDRNALDADVLWRPEISATVLPVTATPRQNPTQRPVFDLATMRCRRVIIRQPEQTHVLFRLESTRLQLVIQGASLREPVHLLTDAIIDHRRFESRVWLLRRLAALVARGDLKPSLHRPDPRGRRLAFVLQALDGHLVGASYREIAAALLGSRRVDEEWSEPRKNLFDRMRRAVSRGRLLMDRGYLDLLK